MLRDIMTLCERQPLKKKLAEVRAKAQVTTRWRCCQTTYRNVRPENVEFIVMKASGH